MLNVIQGLNKSTGGQLVYGVDSFDHVFECAVDCVLGTEKEKMHFHHPENGATVQSHHFFVST